MYASAADEVVRENQKLKKQLKQEKTRVEELAFEVNGLRKDMVELSNAHGEEKEKRMQLERNCLQLESLQALHHRAHKPGILYVVRPMHSGLCTYAESCNTN